MLGGCSSSAIVGDDPNTGVILSVFRGPIEPVGMEGEDNSEPVPGAVLEVERIDSRKSISLTTGGDGKASETVRPGSYRVAVLECPGALALPDPSLIVVISGGFALARFDCDTGIR